jgi:hypothetical protein
MPGEAGWVHPLKQRCVEPGHWVIEGRHVKAVYQGRSRNILGWYIPIRMDGDPDTPSGLFRTLDEARDWIRDAREQETG